MSQLPKKVLKLLTISLLDFSNFWRFFFFAVLKLSTFSPIFSNNFPSGSGKVCFCQTYVIFKFGITFLMVFLSWKTMIFLLQPRCRSAGQVIFGGGGRRKNGPVFLLCRFKNFNLVWQKTNNSFPILTLQSLKKKCYLTKTYLT